MCAINSEDLSAYIGFAAVIKLNYIYNPVNLMHVQ